MSIQNKLQSLIIEEIESKLEHPPKDMIKKITSIDNKDRLKQLYVRIIDSKTLGEIVNAIENNDSLSGRIALKYKQNYDAIIKYIAQEFRGKTLDIFGIETEKIVDVFTFEPVEIRIQTGRLDLIFRDVHGSCYHCEEQRNMIEDDLHRCSIYHFQAVRQFGSSMTDILLISGQPYSGPRQIQTKSGLYKPIFIDLTGKDGYKCLSAIKAEIQGGNYDSVIELIFVPLYGNMQQAKRQELAKAVIQYEIDLLKTDKIYEKLVVSTLIMCNKILDKQTLQNFYEEVKHMIDILEIAREDGEQKGMEKGMEKGTLKAVQEMLMEVLATKLGVIPYRIVNEIKSINTVETLKTLFRQAMTCDNLHSFEGKLMLATA